MKAATGTNHQSNKGACKVIFDHPESVLKLTEHATGFSQWLVTKFLSAEFIRRSGFFDWRVVLPHDRNFRRQFRAMPSKKPVANRHSLPFGSAGASPSHSFSSLVPLIIQHDADMLCDEVFLQPFPAAFKPET